MHSRIAFVTNECSIMRKGGMGWAWDWGGVGWCGVGWMGWGWLGWGGAVEGGAREGYVGAHIPKQDARATPRAFHPSESKSGHVQVGQEQKWTCPHSIFHRVLQY